MPSPHLSLAERYHIEKGFAAGLSAAVIAARLGRHRDTVCREKRRHPGPYQAAVAQAQADARKQRSAANHPVKSAALWRQVAARIRRDESPEQVVLARARYRAAPVSIQAIYDYLQRDRQQGGSLNAHRRKPPRPRARRDGRAKSWAHHSRPIRKRPKSAWIRKRVGHLEIDTMAGKKRDQVRILVVVDRCSSAVMLKRIVGGDAKRTLAGLKAMLAQHPYLPVLTMTSDRGQEFALLTDYLGARHFVCDPHRPNQRGLCENTIGLLRQYFPKYQSLDQVTQAELNQVADKLNRRPRKRFDGRSPFDVLSRRINAYATRS